MSSPRYTYKSTLKVDKDRLIKRTFAVANMLKFMVTSNQSYFGIEPYEAYSLGLLHNIGAMYSTDLVESIGIGSSILRKQDYKFADEVGNQYGLRNSYLSRTLDLLNYINLTTSESGERCTMDYRIKELITNNKLTSTQEKNLYDLSSYLKYITQLND